MRVVLRVIMDFYVPFIYFSIILFYFNYCFHNRRRFYLDQLLGEGCYRRGWSIYSHYTFQIQTFNETQNNTSSGSSQLSG